MVEIVEIKFRKSGKLYYFDPAGLKLSPGDSIIVETARGVEIGEVVSANKQIDESKLVSPLKPVIRKATEKELKHAETNKLKEKEAYKICVEKIQKHNLEMKLIDVQYAFDNSKLLFYFSSINNTAISPIVNTDTL